MASKTSAAATEEPVDVLFALHENFDLMDFAGTLEVLQTAQHNSEDESTKVFDITIAAGEPKVLSSQGVLIGSQISWKEAHGRLDEFDVLIVVGGNTDDILKKKAEPIPLITAYSERQKADPTRERTLMSICTGSLFLAELGILSGLSATTHHSRITTLEVLCSQAVIRNGADHTDVIEDARYVVNNLRFDLGDEDENPYIRRKSDTSASHAPGARKGSMSFKGAGRRESIVRRSAMRLGGLRVITSGGVAAGMDAALYLVSILASEQVAEHVAKWLELTWTKGVVVDGLDV